MQAILPMFHQCIKVPFNGTEVLIPGDNSMSIKILTITKSLVLNNRVANEARPSLANYKKKIKMMRINVGEHTLDSISTLPISPCSYGKLSK